MAHTRSWSNATPANGDALSAGAGEIRNARVDIDERMSLEHAWGDSTTYDGVHLPGKAAVVENQSTAATIEANGGDFLAAYNGSVAAASDTQVMYVKVGTENDTDGTWTAIEASGYSPSTVVAGTVSVTFPNGMIFKWGTQVLTNTSYADTTVTFSVAFPNTCYTIQLTDGKTNEADGDFAMSAHTLTASTFKIRARLGTRHTPVHWLAIGF